MVVFRDGDILDGPLRARLGVRQFVVGSLTSVCLREYLSVPSPLQT